MEATFEGGQGPEGAVVPWMDGIIYFKLKTVPCTTAKATVLCTILNLTIIFILIYTNKRFYIFLLDNFIWF
jgi:hypothetical protein